MSSLNKEYDYLFKIVIIGNSGVGKSAILTRFADDTFKDSYLATIGVDFRFKTIKVKEKKVKLQIWDTAGQERFRTITNAYYKGADGIIVVYDILNSNTFKDIDQFWFNEIESYAESNVNLMLLGNKNDVSDGKQVSFEEGQKYSESKSMDFYETSAKTADHIQLAFETIASKLVEKKEVQLALKKERQKERRERKQQQGGGNESNGSQNSSFDTKNQKNNNNVQLNAQNNNNTKDQTTKEEKGMCC